MSRKLKVFLDTSVILAGLNSPTGAAGVILAACFAKQIIPIISPQVIAEADRNIIAKFPKLTTAWQSFLLIPPKVTKDPTINQKKKTQQKCFLRLKKKLFWGEGVGVLCWIKKY